MKRLFILLMAVISLASCTKDDKQKAEKDPICMDGRMNWGGSPAADGTGWSFVLAETNEHYFLKDIPAAYKQHNLQVAVCIKDTGEKIRFFSPTLYSVYEIVTIKKK